MSRPIHRLVVLSDAHLGAVPLPVEEALLRFLDQVPSLGDGLLLNGDLFGFWFAYRRAIPRTGIRVIGRMGELARRIPVLMTGGNHDRWGDPFWEELGITYHPRELGFRLGELTALAVHGDQVPGDFPGSRLKSALFQSRVASLVYRLLPAELGFRVTAPLARPEPPDSKAAKRGAGLQHQWATALLRNGAGPDLLIMGHTHRAIQAEPVPGRRYLNPGAWFDGGCYAIATEDSIELSRFPGW